MREYTSILFKSLKSVTMLPVQVGSIVTLKWSAKATLDRKLAADTNSQVEFRVLAITPPDLSPAGQYGTCNEPGEAQMALDLLNKEFINNTMVMGSLVATPVKSFTANEVRLELACLEYVPDVGRCGHENTRETVAASLKLAGKTQLQAGQRMEFPFQMQLPLKLAPSAQLGVW